MPVSTQTGPPCDNASQAHIEIIVKAVTAVYHMMSALHPISAITITRRKKILEHID